MAQTAFRLSNADIDYAFRNRQFVPVFQPIYRLSDGRPLRLEMFARWRHPGLGELPPGAFLSFFEQQGRVSELTRHLFAELIDAYGGWIEDAPQTIGASFNLAPGDLGDETLPQHLKTALLDAEIDPQTVTVDIPLNANDAAAVDAVSRTAAGLKEVGVRVAAEARGRAVEALRRIDPDVIDDVKTGGAAILRFAKTVRGPGLTQIAELLDHAKSVGARPIAVGVEDQSALGALRELGFFAAQGNFLARPGSLDAFTIGRINEAREKLGLARLDSEGMRALLSEPDPPREATAAPAKRRIKPTSAARREASRSQPSFDLEPQAAGAAPTDVAAPMDAAAPAGRSEPGDPLKALAETAKADRPPVDGAKALQTALAAYMERRERPFGSSPAEPSPGRGLNITGFQDADGGSPSSDDPDGPEPGDLRYPAEDRPSSRRATEDAPEPPPLVADYPPDHDDMPPAFVAPPPDDSGPPPPAPIEVDDEARLVADRKPRSGSNWTSIARRVHRVLTVRRHFWPRAVRRIWDQDSNLLNRSAEKRTHGPEA